MERGARWLVWLPVAVYLAALAGFATASPYAVSDFPLDDAWIHRVYARAFAFGGGFAYNDGLQEAGATSPLWVVLSAPAHWLEPLGGTAAATLAVKGLGGLLGAVLVALTTGIACRLTGSPAAAVAAGCWIAVDPDLLFSALSGMETLLVAALWLGAAAAAIASRRWWSAALLGLAPLARPEAAVILPLAVVGLGAATGLRDRFWLRPRSWLLLGLPSLVWALFLRAVTGHWLPNTFYLKAHRFALGGAQLSTLWSGLGSPGWGRVMLVVGLTALLAWLLVVGRRDTWPVAMLLGVAPAAFLTAVVGSREVHLEGYYWTRWLDPGRLVLACAAAIGIGLLLVMLPDRARLEAAAGRWLTPRLRRPLLLAWALAVGAALLAASPLARGYLERRQRLWTDSRAVHRIDVEPALWVRDHTPAGAVVGADDAGAVRYFGGRYTVDLLGLNRAEIAFGRLDAETAAAAVDWLVVFPRTTLGASLLADFEPRRSFALPLAEYTVCPCPDQTIRVVAERRR